MILFFGFGTYNNVITDRASMHQMLDRKFAFLNSWLGLIYGIWLMQATKCRN